MTPNNLSRFTSLSGGRTVNEVSLPPAGRNKPPVVHAVVSADRQGTRWSVMDAKGTKAIASLTFDPQYGLRIRKATDKVSEVVVTQVLTALSEQVVNDIESQGSIFLAICVRLYNMLTIDFKTKGLFDPAQLAPATPEQWWDAFMGVADELTEIDHETTDRIRDMFLNYMSTNQVDMLQFAPASYVTLDTNAETITESSANESDGSDGSDEVSETSETSEISETSEETNQTNGRSGRKAATVRASSKK